MCTIFLIRIYKAFYTMLVLFGCRVLYLLFEFSFHCVGRLFWLVEIAAEEYNARLGRIRKLLSRVAGFVADCSFRN